MQVISMHKIFENKLTLIIVIILVAIFSISLKKTRLKTEYSEKVLKQKSLGVEKLKEEVDKLEEKNRVLDNKFYKEKIIRNELLMQKPGEVVIQLPPEATRPSPTLSPTPTPSNIKKWEKLMFK